MKDMFEWQGYDCSWMKRNANGYNVIIHIRSMYAQFIFICIFQRKTYHGILVKRQNSFWNGWCWKHKQSKQMNSYKINVSIGSANNTARITFAFSIFKYNLHWNTTLKPSPEARLWFKQHSCYIYKSEMGKTLFQYVSVDSFRGK